MHKEKNAEEKVESFDDQVLDALSNLGKPSTSTEIADQLGLKGEDRRGKVRRSMRRLEKVVKVKVSLAEGKRRQYLYEVV